MKELPEIYKPLYQCKKCKSTNIEAVYYFPHAIGFIQEDNCMKIVYRDTDEIQLVQCYSCGNAEDYGLERRDEV